MPRKRERTTTKRTSYTVNDLRAAVKRCLEAGENPHRVAKETGIPWGTLKDFIKKVKASSFDEVNFNPWATNMAIFTANQEQELYEYLIQATEIHYGQSNLAARTLACAYALRNSIKVPKSWIKNNVAGKDWLFVFMKRHNLSFGVPEGTSLSRATSFTKPTVNKFFDTLLDLLNKHSFGPEDIYNLDETVWVTVQKPQKGSEQLHR